MPNTVLCKGLECPLKEYCYRFTSEPSVYQQSYFVTPPFYEEDDGKTLGCKKFLGNKKWQEKL